MSKLADQDSKTQQLFTLLGLCDPAKRQEFVRLASAGPLTLSVELPAHFRLDSLTEPAEVDADAELA